MGLINLNIYPRSTTGKNANRRTRAAGRIPAVVYGKDQASVNYEIDTHEFNVAMLHLGGRSAIISLKQEGVEEENIALLREVQSNPCTDEYLHVDLMQIPRGVEVTVPVNVQVVGFCPFVKNGEASVAMSITSIDVSCRPSQLPEVLEIDISELQINDKIFVKDVVTPAGEIVSDGELLVLNIKPSMMEEEVEEVEEGEEGEEGEGEEGEESTEEKSE
jgi:large subunit ribosomal protein L25